MRYSVDSADSKNFAITRIMFEIKEYRGGIETEQEDFQPVITARSIQATNAEVKMEYYVHFEATDALIDRFTDSPEAII